MLKGNRNRDLATSVGGPYSNWLLFGDSNLKPFKKKDYPYFCKWIAIRPDEWYTSVGLDTTPTEEVDENGYVYISDHKWLKGGAND